MGSRRGLLRIIAAWAFPALAVLTLALGVSAWLDQGQPFSNALYKSIALFDIGNTNYDGTNKVILSDPRIRVGRWTGLTAVFGTAILALMALLQERVALMMARWLRQDVVVVGSDGVAIKAFEAARQAKKSVVWLGAPNLGTSTINSIALPWPPEDQAKSVLEHAGDAAHVLIAQPDDASALAVVRSARRAAPNAWITVLMHDVRLAEDAAETFNEPRTRVLSQAAVAARALSLEHPPFLMAKERGHTRVHALLVGFGRTGQAIARDLIVNGRTTYLDKPRITVIDPRANALAAVMRVRAPEVDQSADLAFVDGEIGSSAIAPDMQTLSRAVVDGGPVTAVYVCLRHDSDALATAGMLQSFMRMASGEPPMIFVRLRDAGVVSTATEGQRGLDTLTSFGELESILKASEFLSAAPDAAARAFNEAYRASLTPEMLNDPDNRAVRPWDTLEETYRQANRDAVAHIPAKLASAGIDPKLWRGVTGIPALSHDICLFRDAQELEALAMLEHERWNAQRRMDGWRWADLPAKDEARRLHPSLAAYEDLTDPVKEYDRIYVRETQARLRATRAAQKA